MSLLKLVFVILAVAWTTNASIGPHFDLAPVPGAYGQPTFLPPPVLPPPVYPAPALHAEPTAPFWPAPILPAAAPLWPTPVLPAPIPAPIWPAPSAFPFFPAPAPLTSAPLPPVFDPIPFAPTYRAIPGPVTKTHHVSVGFAHPVQVQTAKVIAAPHIHPVKLIDGHSHSHAHIHTHSPPLISSLPHHHHQW